MTILPKPNRTLAATAVLAAFFVLFYLKYVPLIPGFQALVLASGLTVLILGALRPEAGTLAFLFAFPVVNAWPYLFGIDESIPHAPTALVLFLFFALGRLAGRSFGSRSSPGASLNPLRSPMRFFAGLTALSAAITFWRFAGFFPFVADRFYEFPVNVNGVSAGGARMSVVFHALNFLTGMALFALVRPQLRDARFRMRALAAAAAGILAASGAGLAQKLVDPAFGNTAFWANMGQINGTFKDPNAFATVLSLLLPLLAVAFFRDRGRRRLLFGAAVALSLAVFPFIGARSPLLGLGAATAWLVVAAFLDWRRSGGRIRKAAIAGILLALAIAVGLGVVAAERSRLFERLSANISTVAKGGGLVDISPERYFLWREALAMTGDHPISGVGVGAFIVELPNYYAADKAASNTPLEGWKRIDSAENLPLQVGAELGIAGVIGLAWLLAAIIGLCRRATRPGGRRDGPPPRDRIFYVGAAAGLLSFALNAMFHSYVGSFETAYSFWFLAAYLASAAVPGEARSGQKRGFSGFAVIGLILFAAVLFRDAGHSLAPGERWKTYSIGREFGLYRAEKTADGREFRWTREYGAFPVPPNARRVVVPIHAGHPDIASRPVDVEFTLVEGFFRAKVCLSGVRLRGEDWRTVELLLPDRYGPEAFLLVTVSRIWVPLQVTGASDTRRLGVAVGTLSFPAR